MKRKMIPVLAAALMITAGGTMAAGPQLVLADDGDTYEDLYGEWDDYDDWFGEYYDDRYDDYDALYDDFYDDCYGYCHGDCYGYCHGDCYDEYYDDLYFPEAGGAYLREALTEEELQKLVDDGTITPEEKDKLLTAYDKIKELEDQISKEEESIAGIEDKIAEAWWTAFDNSISEDAEESVQADA